MFSCNAGTIFKERCHRHFINCINSVFIVCESLILDGWCLMVCCSCEQSQNKEAVAESCANAGRAALCRTLNDSPIPNKSGKHPQHLNGTHHYKKKTFPHTLHDQKLAPLSGPVTSNIQSKEKGWNSWNKMRNNNNKAWNICWRQIIENV